MISLPSTDIMNAYTELKKYKSRDNGRKLQTIYGLNNSNKPGLTLLRSKSNSHQHNLCPCSGVTVTLYLPLTGILLYVSVVQL